jgi:ribulose-5-phosphate 4-epimerase/fuculose-1-phosphate aldolase
VIHANPRVATAFSCRTSPMTAFLDAMRKFGDVPVLPRRLAVDSQEFGQAIVDHFLGLGARFTRFGGGVFYPYHGLLVAGPTLDDAFDLLERIEYNALAIVLNSLLELSGYDSKGK